MIYLALEGDTMAEKNYDMNTRMKYGFPKITKKGAVSPNGEMTPFVHDRKLYRLELEDRSFATDSSVPTSAVIRDCESGKIISRFGEGCYYFSAYTENDTVYVLGVKSKRPEFCGDTVMIFESRDLINWAERELISNKGWKFFNTALTKSPEGYVLLLEANEPKEFVGDYPFTFFFATSPDMVNWTFMDYDLGFSKSRYMGGPWMKYSEGWYYVISVTELPCKRYTNYIYRTKDFADWEVGLYNPLLMPDENDRLISENCADLSEEMKEKIKTAFISSNSDIDMCELDGKTYINYCVGNQLGFYYMAEAEYDGTVAEFLKRNFE